MFLYGLLRFPCGQNSCSSAEKSIMNSSLERLASISDSLVWMKAAAAIKKL
jgi:hypothetical protein